MNSFASARAALGKVAENIIKVWSASSLESVYISLCQAHFGEQLTPSGHNLLQVFGPVCVKHLVRFIDNSVPTGLVRGSSTDISI